MDHTTRDVLGRAAYLKQSCEILLSQLRKIENLVSGSEQLTPMREAMLADASRWSEGAKDHLELASQHADEWQLALAQVLSMGTTQRR
jgi:hypothetical protein